MKTEAKKDLLINRVGVRASLDPRREPYWGPALEPNRSLGYRKIGADSGSWIARIKLGKRQFKWLGADSEKFTFEHAKAAALAWFSDLDKEAARKLEPDRPIPVNNFTVQDACLQYVRRLEETKKRPEAAHDAKKRFQRTVDGKALASMRLVDLKRRDLQGWLSGLGLAPASNERTFSALRAAFNLAIRQDEELASALASRPWEHLEHAEVPDNRRTLFLDLKQRRALLKASKGALKDLISGAMLTGCRAGELTGALCQQFDPRTGLMIFVGKTGARTVPLATPALALFKRLTKGKPATAPVFTRDDGKPWAHSDWDELVREAAKKAELPTGVVLYTCRHSFISEAISRGLSTLEVARLVGTSLQMIEKHYGQMIPTQTLARLSKVKFV